MYLPTALNSLRGRDTEYSSSEKRKPNLSSMLYSI